MPASSKFRMPTMPLAPKFMRNSETKQSGAQSSAQCSLTDEELARNMQRDFDAEVSAKEERARSQCPCCLDIVPFDQAIQLDCEHRVCCDCFFTYIEMKIKEKRVAEDELCCPMPSCGVPITVLQVEGSTKGTKDGAHLWDRFLAARAELWRPCEREGEVLCVCPTPGCESRFLASAFLADVKCPKCEKSFCPKCQHRHPGMACERYATWRRAGGDAADQAFDELLRKEKWQRCPCCSAPCERQYGCNFITCYSEQCRGKKNFCYLCGEELSATQHFTHFPHGLFENACHNCDRRGEEGLPEAGFFAPRADAAGDNWWVRLFDDFRCWLQGQEARGGAAGGA